MPDITGAIDLHVHTSPDVYDRSVDDATLVREAEAAGMGGVMLKSHHTLTADRATIAQTESKSVNVFGGLVLNLTVGGLNPVAAETAILFGARQIWMPTLHAKHCLEVAEQAMFRAEAEKGREGITILDRDGTVRRDLEPILEMMRDHDVILGTGHISPEESLILIEHAKSMGLTRFLVTHPLMSFTRFAVEQMKAAAEMGAKLEFDYLSCSPHWHAAVSPARTAEAIRAVGAANCVLATDGGQTFNPHPARMLRDFGEALMNEGVPEPDLRTMMRDNPARLLGV